MENDFNYELVPPHYIHCFNHECTRRKECLRHKAAEHCTSLHSVIRIVNPAAVPGNSDECAYFHPVRKIRMAWGVGHLLDNVPYNTKPLSNRIFNPIKKRD